MLNSLAKEQEEGEKTLLLFGPSSLPPFLRLGLSLGLFCLGKFVGSGLCWHYITFARFGSRFGGSRSMESGDRREGDEVGRFGGREYWGYVGWLCDV